MVKLVKFDNDPVRWLLSSDLVMSIRMDESHFQYDTSWETRPILFTYDRENAREDLNDSIYLISTMKGWAFRDQFYLHILERKLVNIQTTVYI